MREIVGSNVDLRHVRSYEDLIEKVGALRMLGYRIGLTSGTWDLMHVGHARYIELLKKAVDIVIVGVDSDEKTQERKGLNRPIVPEAERIETLCHLRHVDLVFIKGVEDPHGKLVESVKPDVLLTVEETYDGREEELTKLKVHCGEIMTVPPQATTSTTARIRLLHVTGISEFKERIDTFFQEFIGGAGE